MNILTDILSLIRRGVYAETAGSDDVLVLGVNEEPDMTGVASPIPYKSVKLIKIKDLKVAGSSCDYKNSPTVPPAGTGQVYQKTEVDATTKACTVFFRSLKSMSSNLTFATSADDNFIEITTEGEPNTAANVGSGAPVWKDKVGETLNFRSLVQGTGITIGQSINEITIGLAKASMDGFVASGTSGLDVTIDDSNNILSLESASGDILIQGSNPNVMDFRLASRGVVGSYTNANITVNDKGIITAASNGSGGGGGMTDFLIGGDSGSNQTVSDGVTVDIEGGDGISTVGTGGPKVVVNMDHYYQAYVCKLDQTGTNNPTESIVYNDTGLTITWTRVGVGSFRAQWSTPVNAAKVTVNAMCTFKNAPNILNVIAFSNASFTLNTYNLQSTSQLVDSVFQDTPIEIRIYP